MYRYGGTLSESVSETDIQILGAGTKFPHGKLLHLNGGNRANLCTQIAACTKVLINGYLAVCLHNGRTSNLPNALATLNTLL